MYIEWFSIVHTGSSTTKFIIVGAAGGVGLVMGAIIVCLLLVICQITQRYGSKRQAIEVKDNVAYETVNFQKVYSEVQ